jgi:hypothetical protein
MCLAKRKTIGRKKLADNGTLAMLDEINIINRKPVTKYSI